jgi:hypothetical protein
VLHFSALPSIHPFPSIPPLNQVSGRTGQDQELIDSLHKPI